MAIPFFGRVSFFLLFIFLALQVRITDILFVLLLSLYDFISLGSSITFYRIKRLLGSRIFFQKIGRHTLD